MGIIELAHLLHLPTYLTDFEVREAPILPLFGAAARDRARPRFSSLLLTFTYGVVAVREGGWDLLGARSFLVSRPAS